MGNVNDIKEKKECLVCGREYEGTPRQKYCLRCGKHVKGNLDSCAECASALKKAWNKEADGFICYYTGEMLDEEDWHSPWALSFDHLVPGQAKLVACCRVVNSMKQDLSEEEFKGLVKELDRHWKGRRFDKGVAKFEFWKRPQCYWATRPQGHQALGGSQNNRRTVLLALKSSERVAFLRTRPQGERTDPWGTKTCVVCGDGALKRSRYCRRCHNFVESENEHETRMKALKKGWSSKADGFVCHYTGIKLEEKDRTSPWYLTFDHKIPGRKGGTLLVAARFVNGMKTDLAEDEFRAMTRQLVSKFKGGQFDRSKVEFRYYHRGVRPKSK